MKDIWTEGDIVHKEGGEDPRKPFRGRRLVNLYASFNIYTFYFSARAVDLSSSSSRQEIFVYFFHLLISLLAIVAIIGYSNDLKIFNRRLWQLFLPIYLFSHVYTAYNCVSSLGWSKFFPDVFSLFSFFGISLGGVLVVIYLYTNTVEVWKKM